MTKKNPKTNLRVVSALWLALCGLGFLALVRYQATPGDPAAPPERWPAESALAPVPGRGTLLLFMHPRCPCTRASVDSLAWIMSRSAGRVAAYAVFYKPPEFPDGWEKTGLWRAAAAIPGVTAVKDEDGTEARRFGARTSGQAVLYDAGGRGAFSGGITAGRGHFGDNQGRESVLALASGRSAPAAGGPVFGCSLLRAVPERAEAGGG